MGFIRTGDPLYEFDRWDAENYRREQKLPVCSECGRTIFEDYMYKIKGEIYCDECIGDFKVYIDEEEDFYGY